MSNGQTHPSRHIPLRNGARFQPSLDFRALPPHGARADSDRQREPSLFHTPINRAPPEAKHLFNFLSCHQHFLPLKQKKMATYFLRWPLGRPLRLSQAASRCVGIFNLYGHLGQPLRLSQAASRCVASCYSVCLAISASRSAYHRPQAGVLRAVISPPGKFVKHLVSQSLSRARHRPRSGPIAP